MNLYLEQAAEDIEQAIVDSEQLLTLAKATIQKFTSYLKKKQQEKMDRRFLINASLDDLNSIKQIDKQQLQQLKILDFFNKTHKIIDKNLRDFRDMIPSNPQTFIIEDEQEQIIKQTDQKQVLKSNSQEQKYLTSFQNTQNGGQKNQNSIISTQRDQISNQHNNQQKQKSQNQLLLQQTQSNQQKENISLQIQSAPQLDFQLDNQTCKQKQNKQNKEQIISFGKLQNFSYQKLQYPKQDDGNCIFCGLEANESNLGPLLQINSNINPDEKYNLHEMCGLWSQNLVFFNKQGQCDPKNIDEEVDKSKQTKCFLCGRTGATLGCAVCPNAFHFTCFMKSFQTGKLIESQFKIFCDTHKKKANKVENTSSEDNSQIIKPQKTRYKINQYKAIIKISPRRSPKRYKSFSSKQIKISQSNINTDEKDVHFATNQQTSSIIQESDMKIEPELN
ncbi:unnamed protein product [Paramecium sonneborni]|uniref:PHD-type domain-containing protein n=1 Tax=Paramecium sonneborni TaxID=65129 RepID=A0A8S1R6R3_9CILI|nr:unnamed protein product [Paramecium sonneborni]